MKMDKKKGNVKYMPDEVFKSIGEENLELNTVLDGKSDIQFHGFSIHPQSLRYMTFWQKGLECAECGRKGSYFTLDKSSKEYNGDRRHFNLYAEDGMLMVKDRIIPKEMGGCQKVSNLQTLCEECSRRKRMQVRDIMQAGQ